MIKYIPQYDQMDCGPACIAMIASYYGRIYPLQFFRDNSFITREGVSILGISEAAKKIGFSTRTVKLTLTRLTNEMLPCVLHWNQNHFVVLHKITKNRISKKIKYKIIDPAHGFITLSEEEFKKHWLTDSNKGVALCLQVSNIFYELPISNEKSVSFKILISYLRPHKKRIFALAVLLFIGSCINLTLPFLTKNLIDKGINGKNINLISLILIAQLCIFVGSIVIEVFRNWITLFIGTKININIISEFLKKLLKLPLHFFETKMMGDFNQRIQDHERIEVFLTSQSLLTVFSLITFLVFFGVLWHFNVVILCIYLAFTIIAIIWSLIWLRKINTLDYSRFQSKSEAQNAIYEIINGVSEMKLNKFEEFKRKEWESTQQKLFQVNIKILKINQIQVSGFDFVNQLKNIIVTYFAASYVVQGHMTLGSLLSISYIIGQMNSPLNQVIFFFRSFQLAKLSLARLNEVQNYPEEEREEQIKITNIQSGIYLDNVSFKYDGANSPYVLKNISLCIPKGKVTAIVGASGNGKTTLLKLLVKFYDPLDGKIIFNDFDLKNISALSLRENCGVVMQDGYIFSDSIARNIATGDEIIDENKLDNAVRIANLQDFINRLPLGLNTKIGASGNGISGGQKQRILIARAIYKSPQYIFLDEATSSLDAANEKIIHNNLLEFFKGRTVVIIAHRLSTVKAADQIIVLKNGEIAEKGSHDDLVEVRSEYYNLVKNQLELGV